jgi:hypothetical protein
VTVGTTKRHGRTVLQLAVRWNMTPALTREFLVAFERRGYAVKCGQLWFATEKATRIVGFEPEGE